MENTYLAEIVPKEYEAILREMARLSERQTRMTAHQITNFVLNDVEYPTDWGKLEQSRVELVHRFNVLRDMALEYQEKLLQEKLLAAEQSQLGDDPVSQVRKQILDIKRQRLQLQAESIRGHAHAVLEEAKVFYSVFAALKHLYDLPQAEQERLEAEAWSAKAKNMPTVFEERYGERYLQQALGAELYEEYKRLRQQAFGLLPRELVQAPHLVGNAAPALERKGE